MSSEKPIVDATEGAIKGFLGWTEDKIKEYIAKFLNRDIAFVSNPEIITLAKKQRKTSQWRVFIRYIADSDLRIQFQMGLTLRELETQPKQLADLRGKILKKYGPNGLHIAQFIQNGFFGTFYGNILDRVTTPEKLKFEIENLFKNIEQMVAFIQVSDDVTKKTEEIYIKIMAHSPNTFLICSSGSAIIKCEEIKEKVMKRISGYVAELYKTEFKEVYFLNKSEKQYL